MYTQTSIIIQLLSVPKIHPVTPVIQLLDLEGLIGHSNLREASRCPQSPATEDQRKKTQLHAQGQASAQASFGFLFLVLFSVGGFRVDLWLCFTVYDVYAHNFQPMSQCGESVVGHFFSAKAPSWFCVPRTSAFPN